MFALTDGMHYYLCQHYVDMRKGMTGLYRLVKSDMSLSPVSGDVFVFFSRKRDMVKILRWDILHCKYFANFFVFRFFFLIFDTCKRTGS